MEPLKITIMELVLVSDGTTAGTRIYDQVSGRELRGVQAINWEISVGELARVTLQLIRVPVELKVKTDPIYRHIEL